MNRRTFVPMAPVAAVAARTGLAEPAVVPAGRLKQSLCRWCYAKVPLDELCQAAVKLGLQAMDLLEPKDWPVAQNYGLKLTVVPGPCSIPDGLNRKENHDGIEKRFREVVDRAVAAKASSTIIFSGNRKGMSDEEGLENTRHRAEPDQEDRRGRRAADGAGTAQQQGGTTRTTCATTPRGAWG